jgi:peptidoglycan-associated lipoprotein
MINKLGNLSLVAAVLLALLAGCSTDSTGSGQARGSGEGAFGTAQSSGPSGAAVGRSEIDQEAMRAAVGDTVLFDTDRSDLNSQAQQLIRRWAEFLRQHPGTALTIEGHADERGTREYNLGLAERRATAARTFLVSQGIDARRLTAVSYGKERPAALGSTESAWAQNRRAVAVVSRLTN